MWPNIVFPEAVKNYGSTTGIIFSGLHQTYMFGIGESYDGVPLINSEGYADINIESTFGDFGYTKGDINDSCSKLKSAGLLDDYAFVGGRLYFKMTLKGGRN